MKQNEKLDGLLALDSRGYAFFSTYNDNQMMAFLKKITQFILFIDSVNIFFLVNKKQHW